jgi:hypothetical protein
MKKFKDMTGQVFHNLKVISFCEVKNTNAVWLCECLICGNKTPVTRPNLRSGNTKDCGCMKSEKLSESSIVHGMSKTPTWNSWNKMNRRIRLGEKHSKIYGMIDIENRWVESFENFLADMGERPKGKTLDRIDNTKGYFKDNCRWATQSEQNRNKSTNVILTYQGKTMCAIDWAKEIGIHRDTIRKRLKRNLPIEQVLKK